MNHDTKGGYVISPFKGIQQKRYVFENSAAHLQNSSNSIQVQSVKTPKDLKLFFKVPFLIYQNNPYWVAPFWGEYNDFFHKKNIFWSHADCELFIARKQGKIVGRIASFVDHLFCDANQLKIGFFGFFECVEDYEVASALLQNAQDWLAARGMKRMQGPIDGRIDVGCGFLVQGHDSRPSLLSTFSPAYYALYAQRFGLNKFKDIYLYSIDLNKQLPEVLKEKARQCAASGITVRPFHRLRTRKELNWWTELFLETFTDHWGYVPVSSEEVKKRFGIKQLRWYVEPQLFLIAEDNGSPVAYLFATPDYNQVFHKMKGRLGLFEALWFLYKKRKITTGKLHLIGIKKEFRNQNIGSYLNYEILVEMKKRGYHTAEVGWIDEKNTVAQTTIALTGAKLYKTHRVFEKTILPDMKNTS